MVMNKSSFYHFRFNLQLFFCCSFAINTFAHILHYANLLRRVLLGLSGERTQFGEGKRTKLFGSTWNIWKADSCTAKRQTRSHKRLGRVSAIISVVELCHAESQIVCSEAGERTTLQNQFIEKTLELQEQHKHIETELRELQLFCNEKIEESSEKDELISELKDCIERLEADVTDKTKVKALRAYKSICF